MVNLASTHQCRQKPHGVAAARKNPVKAEALARFARRGRNCSPI